MEKDNKPTKHTVKRGAVYVELKDGTLSRNYITVGGKRVYVDANEGDKITADAAHKAEK